MHLNCFIIDADPLTKVSYLGRRMCAKVVEADSFGVVDELAPLLVWRKFGKFVKNIISNLVHEPVETLAVQALLQPVQDQGNVRESLGSLCIFFVCGIHLL